MRPTQIRKLPHEVFQLLENTDNVDDRVKILQDNGAGEIQTILQGAFHPNVIFDLPTGAPPYKADTGPAGQQQTPLHKHIPNLLKCVRGKGGLDENDRYTRLRRENTFLRILEIAHEKDAEILVAMKDKKLSDLYPSLTASLVRKAFPAILPES